MDAPHALPPHAEVREHDLGSRRRKEEAVKCETLHQLPAYCDDTLSVEAAQQLVRMAKDKSYPAAKGQDLPTGDKQALLKKAAVLENAR